MNQALQILLLWLVLQAAVTDLAVRRIPNVLVLAGLVIAAVLHWRVGPPMALVGTWLAGMASGFFLFLPLYLLRGMAAGDVKLMAMTGAFVGPAMAAHIALVACLAGGVLGLGMVILNGRWAVLWRNLGALGLAALRHTGPVTITRAASAGGIPYGVAIALGTAFVVL